MLWAFVGKILLARWLIVAVVTLSALAGGMVVVTSSSPQYDATARVMLNIYKPDPITGRLLGKKTIDPFLQTQMNFIRDLQVVGPATEALGWLDDPSMIQAYNESGDPRPMAVWLAQALVANLQTKLVDDSNVIEIRYRGESPEVAELVAGAIRDAYIAATIQDRRMGAASSADAEAERAERLRVELARLERQKREMEAETGIILSPTGKDIDGERLLALSSTPKATSAFQQPIISRRGSSSGQLSQLEMELAQASATLGPNHPRLAELRAARNALAAMVAREDNTSGEVAASVLGRERAKTAEFEAQKSRVLDQRQNLLRLRLVQDQINFKVKALEKSTQQLALMRSLSTSIESGLTPVGRVESSKTPAFPNVPLILGGTGGIGLFAGIVIALLVEMFNLRVRTLVGLRIATSVPILGRMPALGSPGAVSTWSVRRLRKLKPVAA